MPPLDDQLDMRSDLEQMYEGLQVLKREHQRTKSVVSSLVSHVTEVDQLIDQHQWKLDALMHKVNHQTKPAEMQPVEVMNSMFDTGVVNSTRLTARPETITSGYWSSLLPPETPDDNEKAQNCSVHVKTEPVESNTASNDQQSLVSTPSVAAIEMIRVGSPIHVGDPVVDQICASADDKPSTSYNDDLSSTTANVKPVQRKIPAIFRRRAPPAAPRFDCHRCSSSFTSRVLLHAHHTREHPSTNLVDRKIKSKKPTTNDYQCKLCGALFPRQYNLDRHMAYKHVGDRPHICSDCGKTFVEKKGLVRHKRIHARQVATADRLIESKKEPSVTP